ncbi:hypothetical protein GFL63_36595 [Rhizobium leguminosarum bv. viciae]|uniref:glutamine amidotransferase n=1 Tax=Rhizobium leguminosarum TaxID=384 RepID=UPI0014410909|nr:glutamine amidotransferase [Rhizobium leguminosarum]NKK04168.1 hypothetical protein [Rhizobium leguminosarum bv. viciae]
MKPVLLAGETFHTTSLSAKGLEVRASSRYSNGALRFVGGLSSHGIEVVQIGGERCEAEFPKTLVELDKYSAVIISDVGALSLLYTPETRLGKRSVNRLELLREWTALGGGLMMAGGYTSYQGIDGSAMFHGTAIEEALPVALHAGPDGLEAPEGLDPVIEKREHPVFSDLPSSIPYVLGMNRVKPLPDGVSTTLAHCENRGQKLPLLSVREYHAGRSLAWTTDIAPHWLSDDFMRWEGYDKLMVNMVKWVAKEI